MKNDPYVLQDYRILVPEIRDEDAEGDEVARRFILGAMQHVPTDSPRAEWVGLYHLLWRSLTLLNEAEALREVHAPLAKAFCERAFFELGIHLSSIIKGPPRPSTAFQKLSASLYSHRLRGYLAWIVANELFEVEKRLQPKEVQALFDPEPARSHADWLRSVSETVDISSFFSEPETFTDAEAERDRAKYEDQLTRKREVLRRLFDHVSLMEWRSRVIGHPPPGLDMVLEPRGTGKGSIHRSMTWVNLEVARLRYSHSSALVHGSRLESFLELFVDGTFMAVIRSEEESEQTQDYLESTAKWVGYSGLYLARRLLEEGN